MCSYPETSFNANFSVHNQVFYLVIIIFSCPNFVCIFYTYRALKIHHSVHVSIFRSPPHIRELKQIVKLLSTFLLAVTDSFWSPYILPIKQWNSVMTIIDIMDVSGATDSDLTRNPLKVFILKVYTRSTCDSSNKTIFVRTAALCEFQRLLPTSSSKGLNLNSMNYNIYHLLSNKRNFSVSRICWELQLIFRNGSEIK
jgi:hypothetical protein